MRPLVLFAVLVGVALPGAARGLDHPVRDLARDAVTGPSYVADRLELRLTPAAAPRAWAARRAPAGGGLRLERLGVAAVDALAAPLGIWFEPEFRGETPPPAGARDADFTAFYIAHLPAGVDLESTLGTLRGLPEVLSADPIGVLPVSVVPDDSLFAVSTWYDNPTGHSIHAPQAWDVTTGDTSIVVAILDTGVLPYHPDLGGTVAGSAGQIWTNVAEKAGAPGVDDDGNGFVDDTWGWDFVSLPSGSGVPLFEDWRDADNDPNDYARHGTIVAGLVGALSDNLIGVTGTAWKVRLMPLRIGWASTSAPLGLVDMSFVAQAVRYATRMGANVMNCSFASLNQSGLGAALDAATRAGVVTVVAAGNNFGASYIGTRDDAIAVAATDAQDYVPSFSNLGTWVDLAAPGVGIVSTDVRFPPTSSDSLGYRQPAYVPVPLSGTSFSAPLVSGTLALLQARQVALGRRLLTPLGALLRVRETTDDISALNPFTGYGTGRLNAYRALTDRPTSTAWRAGAATVGPGVPIPLAGPARRIAYLTSDQHLLLADWLTGDTLALVSLPGAPAGALAAADLGGGHGVGLFVGTTNGVMAGFDTTGAALPGFPAAGPGGAVALGAGPALGDLDGDGVLEVVCGADDGSLWAWDVNGATRPGFPVATDVSGLGAAVALSDLDGLAGVEILAATRAGAVHALRGNGAELAGWPVTVNPAPYAPVVTRYGRQVVVLVASGGQLIAERPDGTERFRSALTGTAAEDPALADLDGDGTDEVLVAVTSLDQVDAVDSSGAELTVRQWPAALTSAPQGAPVVGHLRGAGRPCLVILQADGLAAFGDSAQALATLPRPGRAGRAPTLVDLVGDGVTKIVAGSGADSSLIVYDTGPASGAALPMAWPTPRGNYARTGSRLYLTGDALAPAPVADLEAGLMAPDSVALTWSAPGGDGAVGRAALYELRTTTFKPVVGRVGAGTRLEPMPAPDSAGTPQSAHVASSAPGTTSYFWLRATDEAGNTSLASNVVAVGAPLGVPAAPREELSVLRRPSARPVSLRWSLPSPAAARLRIYDVAGRLVRDLDLGRSTGGVAQWNGRDEGDHLVPAGLFFARLTGGSFHAQTRVVLLP